MRSREEVAELTMAVFDRLEREFPGLPVEDAVLLVEISDTGDIREDELGRESPSTLILLESTSDRVVVQVGIVDFAHRTMIGRSE